MTERRRPDISSDELLRWMEQEVRTSREAEARAREEVDSLRRQVSDLAYRVEEAEKETRTIDPRLRPIAYLPEKLHEIERDTESVRQDVTGVQASLDAAIRVLEAGAQAERNERSVLYRQQEEVAGRLDTASADIAQLRNAVTRANATIQDLIQRQGQVEKVVEQITLRLERSIEVHRDIEERLREEFIGEKEDRFAVVFERLQVLGEMMKRTNDAIEEVAAEQTLREDVLEQIDVWRAEHGRIDGRLAALEETGDTIFDGVDRLKDAITLLEGRHTGLADRVAAVRTDIAEIVDKVRDEFAKFNQLQEKSRKRQVDALEQEMRELKFHRLRPPEMQ